MLGFPKLPLGLNGDIPRYLHALHMRLAAEKLTYVLAFLPRVSEMRFVELTDTNMPVKMFMGKNLALVYAYPDGTAVRTYFTTQIPNPSVCQRAVFLEYLRLLVHSLGSSRSLKAYECQ
jgi:hypothetical protein